MQKLIQECSSRYGWLDVDVPSHTDPSKTYRVMVPPVDWNRNESVCECTSYEYRGHCRHQHEALIKICNWSELDSVQQTQLEKHTHTCPECGGSTVTVEVNNE